MKLIPPLFLLLAPLVMADTVVTNVVGFNKVTCLQNSDTIVGVPLRQQGSINSCLTANPSASTGSPTLTLSNNALPTLGHHFAKFTSGTRQGRWYDITANTADTITIDLNGDNLTGVVADDKVIIAEYWTLDTLFPPAQATTNPATTGIAIVASANTLATGRKTEIRLRDLAYLNISPPYTDKYFIHNGIWKRSGSGNTNFGTTEFVPDTFFTISHPSTVGSPTTYLAYGEVDVDNEDIPLFTSISGSVDNIIAIPRPINVTLDQLDLRQSPAFVASANTLSTGRRDEVLVFDNGIALNNKTPSAKYYVHNGIWKKSGGGNTNRGTDTIPAGAGFIIRKYQTVDGATAFWSNSPTY